MENILKWASYRGQLIEYCGYDKYSKCK